MATNAKDFWYLRNKPKRNVGSFMRSKNWNGYWQTRIGDAEYGHVTIRGYPVDEVIGKLTFVECVYLVMIGSLPTRQQTAVLDLVLRSTLEHGFVSPATVAGRFIASSIPEAPAAAVAAAALAHGSVTGSPQMNAEMLHDLVEGTPAGERAARIRALVAAAIAQGLIIPGLGHPIHKDDEPRAVAIHQGLAKLGAEGEHTRVMKRIGEVFNEQSGKRLPINVDGAFSPALLDIGFKPLHMAGLGIMSFLPGIIAHSVEEITDGVPLRYIPKELGAEYIGEPLRHIPDGRDSRSDCRDRVNSWEEK
jgi:citrate synthase